MFISPSAAGPGLATSPTVSYEAYRAPLLAYVHNMLEPLDWNRSEDFARLAFAQALGSLDLTVDAGMEDQDLPAWLASAARTVIREQTSAATVAAERFVTVRNSTPAVVENRSLEGAETTDSEVSASHASVSPIPLAA